MSQPLTSDTYMQGQLVLDKDTREIFTFNLILEDLSTLPTELKDAQYTSDLKYLRIHANEALAIDPVVGESITMPSSLSGECQQQECSLGNLVTDSLRVP